MQGDDWRRSTGVVAIAVSNLLMLLCEVTSCMPLTDAVTCLAGEELGAAGGHKGVSAGWRLALGSRTTLPLQQSYGLLPFCHAGPALVTWAYIVCIA